MEKRKFLSLIGSLKKREQKKFQRHFEVNHPRDTTLGPILDYLMKYSALSSKTWEEADIHDTFTTVFPGRSYSSKSLNNIFPRLFQHLKEFLIIEKLRDKSFEKEMLWLKVLLERRALKLFPQAINFLQTRLKRSKKIDLWFPYKELRLNYLRYYQSLNSIETKKHLNQSLVNLEDFFIGGWLKFQCECFNRANILQEPIAWTTKDEQIFHLATLNTSDNPFIKSYRYALEYLRNPDLFNFDDILSHYKSNYRSISYSDQSTLLRYLINFCSAKIREGSDEFLIYTFELYKFGLKEELFSKKDSLSSNLYLNIVELACDLSEFQWLDGFQERFIQRVVAEEKEVVKSFSDALIGYAKGDFDIAKEKLRAIKYPDPFFKLRRYALFARIYFDSEEKESDLLADHLRAFEKLLFRNKSFNPRLKEAVSNFIKLLRDLGKTGFKDYADLKERLNNTNPIYYKSWLTKRLKSLEVSQSI